MNARILSCVAVGLLAAACLGPAGCSRGKDRAVSAVGSTSIQPFAEMLADEFNARNPGHYVEVQGGGSTAGIQAIESGFANIGLCSRGLKTEEEAAGLVGTPIALDGVAIVVHNTNKVAGLTTEQVRRIFAGEIRNWSEVGGADKAITLITREEGSGTREAFTKLVMQEKAEITMRAITMPSNGSVKALVEGDPAAIGYISLGMVDRKLKAVAVDGVEATRDAVIQKRYKLYRPFLFVFSGGPDQAARKFLDYVLSDDGQKMLEEQGLVRGPRQP
ncbi:MAG: phosphate ABC transporter substrate-binding protein [Phycisphaerae bacterium]